MAVRPRKALQTSWAVGSGPWLDPLCLGPLKFLLVLSIKLKTCQIPKNFVYECLPMIFHHFIFHFQFKFTFSLVKQVSSTSYIQYQQRKQTLKKIIITKKSKKLKIKLKFAQTNRHRRQESQAISFARTFEFSVQNYHFLLLRNLLCL